MGLRLAADDPGVPVTVRWIALAVMATRTRRIRLGALLPPLAHRHPCEVAREAVTLDHLLDGRLIFSRGLDY